MTTHPQAVREDGRRTGQDEHVGALVAQQRHVSHATPPVPQHAVGGAVALGAAAWIAGRNK